MNKQRRAKIEAELLAARTAIESLRFVRASSDWQAEFTAHLDGESALTLLSPSAARWRVLAAPAGMPLRDLDARTSQLPQLDLAGDFLPGFVSARRELRVVSSGPWTVRVIASSASDVDVGWALVSDGNAARARAWLQTHGALRGEPAAVVARMESELSLHGLEAWLELEWAGRTSTLRMRDDGLHDDRLAGDGLFGAWLPSEVVGEVVARAHLSGLKPRGARVQRSVPLAFHVHEPKLALDGEGELIITSPPIRLTSDFFLANVAVREHGTGKLLVAQIVGHFHVQQNKTDPGPAFQWERLLREARELSQ